MKFISSLSILLASNVAAATEESSRTKNLRSSQSRSVRQLAGVPKRQTEWIKTHNAKRKKYQVQYGGNFSNIKWNNSLKNKAATLAKNMAKNNCEYNVPSNFEYGVNYSKSIGSAKVPTVASAMNNWEKTLNKEYPDNGTMTQVLWSATKYVGCADAYSGDPENMCYATVCVYAKVSLR